ncbi:hypothetical protein HPP92_023972 [Vanilla planifolia]|uniref:glucose-6-phosphate 1-epimerase n=1 Tax=Vanilla planifolia TaxID=51239 RepID=A0A835PMP8_VANPL|nr:hypothetical protein HPP92_023972 [Vanilla planifolia]
MASLAGSFTSSSIPFSWNPVSRHRRRLRGGVRASANLKSDTSLGVRTAEGNGGLPKVLLSSVRGSEAEIYLFGACITSWKPAGGKDLLFLRPDAVFNGQKPISGGIPHCFPQFGPGPMQQHGFARNLEWNLLDSENSRDEPAVTLKLEDSLYTRSMWDFGFQALYKVRLQGKSLSTSLTITNTDLKPFSFTTALHTYFRASISGALVKGLKGCRTLNKDPDPTNPVEGKEERDVVTFPGFVDCIYLGASNELLLENGLGDTLTIKNTDWPDAVLWNPNTQMESSYREFVCVENAQIGVVQMEPGQSWVAEQHISLT